jgi:hypothetical protein
MGTRAQLAVRLADGSFLACHLSSDGDMALADLRDLHASFGRAHDLVAGGDVMRMGGVMGPYRLSAVTGRDEPAVPCVDEDALFDHRLANTSRMFLHAHGGWREVPITAKMDM